MIQANSLSLSNGAKIPAIGLGTWKIPKNDTANMVYESIKLGVRHLDCACDYGNEVEVGQGIARAISEGICTREDLWITSKLWNTYHAKEHVRLACEKSLADLNLTYLDLYLIHFPISQRFVPIEVRYPPEWIYDPNAPNPKIELQPVPLRDTWQGMEELVTANLVRNIGVCNLVVQSVMDLLSYATIKPVVNQVEMHPYLVQQALLDFCHSNGVLITAFSPLGSSSYIELGADAGYGVGVLNEAVVHRIASEVKRTAAQVVLKWNLQRGVAIIPKSSKLSRVQENFSLYDFELSEEQMKEISALNKPMRFNDPGVFCKFMGGAIPIFD